MQRDDVLLLDMLNASREAIEFVSGLTYEEFCENRMSQFAVWKSLEIVGEAASRVNIQTKETNAHIPWADIVGMRNHLVHEYFRINLLRVWETVKRDIPILVSQLETLVPPDDV